MVRKGWKQVTLGDIALFQGGSQPPLSVFSSQKKAGYIRLVQIRDYKTDKYATYIPEKLAKRFCKQDDIMIGRYGPPIFQILRGIEGAYNVALIKALPQGVDKEFLYHTLKREDLFEYIDLLSRRTSGQTGVDLTNLKAFELSIPVLTDEQATIAKALSDVDSLISSLQKLIEKKKAIKQGTMQELLTGKKRLPGFSEEWSKQQLGDICNIVNGGTPSTSIAEFWNGKILWCTPTDITSCSTKYIYTTESKITESGLKASSATLLPKGALLLCSRATIGEVRIAGNTICTNQGFKSLVVHQNISGDYVDLKKYDPDMRHLIDTYLSADPSRVLTSFGGATLVELLVDNGISALKDMPASTPKEQEAVAETIENNIGKEIVERIQSNPKYYEKMSALLRELIEKRKNDVINYEEYLRQIVELARKVHKPESGTEYPSGIRESAAKRAFYDHLNGDTVVANQIYNAVMSSKQDNFRGSKIKERKIWRAIRAVVKDDQEADQLLALVKEQSEF